MCLGVPGRVLAAPHPDTGMGKVSFSGVEKEICLLYVPEAEVGDYVLVHAGFALSRIDEAEAAACLQALEALGEETRPGAGHASEADSTLEGDDAGRAQP